MESDQKRIPRLELLNYALNSLRTGQAAYGRAYYEFRHLPQASLLAQLRLIYLAVEKSVFDMEQPVGSHEKHRDAGPFSEDPRACIFGIEANLAIDYLQRSENAWFAWYQAHAQELKLEAGLAERWKAANKELNGKSTLAKSSPPAADRSYALCG